MSFPRYPKYKDSGVEWLGEVPEHWDVGRLGFLCNKIGSGKTPLGGSGTYADNGILFLRSQNVYDEGLYLDDVVYISEATDEEMRGSRVRPGDILLNITGASIGRTCLVPHDFVGGNVNQHVCIIRLTDPKLRRYVAMFMKSAIVKGQIDLIQTGAAREGLNYSQISKLAIAIPKLSEQTAIAAFLDRETAKIDGLVNEQRRLMELLKEKRQAVISHAVTKGLNPHAPMKPSGIEWLGDVPEHWNGARLRFLFRQVKRQEYPDKAVLSVYRDYGVIRKDSRDDNMNKTPDDLSSYQLVNPGDLVVNKMKSWQGSLGISELEGITSPDYVVFAPCHSEVPKFLHFLLRSPSLVSSYLGISNGIRLAQWRLEPDKFLNLVVFLPPITEQNEISSFLFKSTALFDALAIEAQRAIDLLQERRTALISAAVTGKIDVREVIDASLPARKPYTSWFARQLLAAEILHKCHAHPTTGRVKVQKLIHLCEHVAEIEEIHGSYARKAAGPFDHKVMFGIANGLKKLKWFAEEKRQGRTVYRPLEKAGDHSKYLARWKDKLPKTQLVLDLLGQADTQQCEIVSTLYAAWNDLIIEGKAVTDAAIIDEASNPARWHENKALIPAAKWPRALQWMRDKGLVPTGFGGLTKRAQPSSVEDDSTDENGGE